MSAIVLAGGRGSRLGGVNKALLRVAGQTALSRVQAALAEMADETILIVNDDSLADARNVRFVRDPEPHAGVLPALLAGLEAASHRTCIVLACDMPFVSRDLLSWLLSVGEEYDVVIPVVAGRHQPMHGVFRRDACRLAVAAALARGDRRMISFLDHLRVREVGEDELRSRDPELRSFFNINTPDDLAEARRMAEQGIG